MRAKRSNLLPPSRMLFPRYEIAAVAFALNHALRLGSGLRLPRNGRGRNLALQE